MDAPCRKIGAASLGLLLSVILIIMQVYTCYSSLLQCYLGAFLKTIADVTPDMAS